MSEFKTGDRALVYGDATREITIGTEWTGPNGKHMGWHVADTGEAEGWFDNSLTKVETSSSLPDFVGPVPVPEDAPKIQYPFRGNGYIIEDARGTFLFEVGSPKLTVAQDGEFALWVIAAMNEKVARDA